MNRFPRKTIAVASARRIHAELEIEEPGDIDVEKIAFFYGIYVQYESVEGMDGRIVRDGDNAIITVRDSIPYPAQKRFVIAHELGHYFLHPRTKPIETVTAAHTLSWSEKHTEEYEANLFAAELLMPSSIFQSRCQDSVPGFELLERLSHEFQTTLTATAVQYALTTQEDCAIVSCEGRERRWFVCKPTFPRLLSDTRCHGRSCAAQVNSEKKTDRSSLIEAQWWLDGFYGDHKAYITEEARYFPRLKRALSLLWLHEDI